MAELAVGQRATLTRSFTAGEAGGAAVPNALVGGLFSCLLGTQLPGRGTNWMKQSLRFFRRARVGERLTASVEIVRLRPDKQLVNLRVACVDDAGALVCDGEALVLAREMDLIS
ncbi:MAG TPA: phosphate acetyltransferase [Polyangia bacterium]|jgi:acyl dehydratase